jgi:hypothetical protein
MGSCCTGLISFIPFYPFGQGHGNIPDDQEYNEEKGENNNPFGDFGIHFSWLVFF